jgi:hypothetical protein
MENNSVIDLVAVAATRAAARAARQAPAKPVPADLAAVVGAVSALSTHLAGVVTDLQNVVRVQTAQISMLAAAVKLLSSHITPPNGDSDVP